MAVPKKRHTKSRRNKRRMHIYIDKPTLVDCPQCKDKKMMHMVCKSCGYYKEREVIDTLKGEKDKKQKETEKKKSLSMKEMSKKE